MKVSIEKVPEGVKVTIQADAKSKSLELLLKPEQVYSYSDLLKQALKADKFWFSWET